MKYDIIFSCGHAGVAEFYGDGKKRESKLEYLKNFGLCPECYKKKKRAEEEATPLTLNVGIRPFDTLYPISLFFTGNAYPVKDKIKTLKYFYSECEGCGFKGLFQLPERRWNKAITIDEMDSEIEKVKEVFPDIKILRIYNKVDILTLRDNAHKRHEAEEKKKAEIAAIPVPEKPIEYPTGYWNKKFYSKDTIIYVDNRPVKIEPETAEKIKKYLEDIKEYNRKVYAIENRSE